MSKKILVWDDDLEGDDLLRSFLMQEFTTTNLSSLLVSANAKARSSERKEALCEKVLSLLASGRLSVDSILLSYVKTSRMWLSFKVGNHTELPERNSVSSLMTDFNSSGWHGPIKDIDGCAYYVYTRRVTGEVELDESDSRVIKKRYYRWPVIAKVTDTSKRLESSSLAPQRSPQCKARKGIDWL